METIIVGAMALIGTLAGSFLTYKKGKEDREAGLQDANNAEEERWRRLYDKLDVLEAKQDEHSRKLDKHNGFEGRIIALEVIAEWMQRENAKKTENN